MSAGKTVVQDRKSPRAWGWTGRARLAAHRAFEIPTRVGMDRDEAQRRMSCLRNPHARGDGPYGFDGSVVTPPKSPRAWGWTALRRWREAHREEIPTRVGMDRLQPTR